MDCKPGLPDAICFSDVDKVVAVVLNISAGNDMKLPIGSFLIACIAGGTLLYVG